MNFIVKNSTGENIENLMRQIRYHSWGASQKDGKLQFIRPFETGGAFPRFHIYLRYNRTNKEIDIDLHLDQRKTVYEGAKAHKGEYQGELVQEEAERIKTSIQKIR
ncbi:MAG: hypothetical protein PHU56_01065 [Candidatus Pacebacteria bacterium]|nr:hypothetical protein [Candidatus Paceibacterota bacterium]